MFVVQLFRITWALVRLSMAALGERMALSRHPSKLPRRLRDTLEWLGPTFIKLGQALSLRRDLLPEEYVVALKDLQDHAAPFPARAAVHEIEAVFHCAAQAIVGMATQLLSWWAEHASMPVQTLEDTMTHIVLHGLLAGAANEKGVA